MIITMKTTISSSSILNFLLNYLFFQWISLNVKYFIRSFCRFFTLSLQSPSNDFSNSHYNVSLMKIKITSSASICILRFLSFVIKNFIYFSFLRIFRISLHASNLFVDLLFLFSLSFSFIFKRSVNKIIIFCLIHISKRLSLKIIY